MNNLDFGNWLQTEREKREWSQSDFSRYSGLHRAVISKIESGGTKPMPETLIAMAHAFKISPIVIFRRAGLLPEGTSSDIRFEDWEFLLNQLPEDEQEELRKIAVMKIEKRQKEQSMKSLKPKKVGR